MSANPPRLLAAMAAHLPRHLPALLLFVFLAVHVPSTHGDDPRLPSTYNVNMCLESTWRCGDVEIRYPFYLANATEATADYSGNFSCGYTDLNISCTLQEQTWIATIRLGVESYTVESISYDSDHQTLSLVDRDVLNGGDCPAVRHGVSFNETWLRNSSFNDNLTFFFGCDTGPSEFDIYRIKCGLPPDAGPGYSFVLVTDEHDMYLEQELARKKCKTVVTVPVRGEALMESYNRSNFTSGGYGYVLKRGFELEWSRLTADKCHLCEASKGQCAYGQNREFMGCLCHGGKVGDPDCKKSSKSFTRPFVFAITRPLTGCVSTQ